MNGKELKRNLDLSFPPFQERTFSDTDPQMLFALCKMEWGCDPDESLNEVSTARVTYDKFAPRVSRRRF